MSGESPVAREEQATIDIEKKDGLLEELNVPPAAIKFIRENARNLQLAGAALVVLILAWSAFDYYRETQREASTSLLHTAMQEVELGKRNELLQGVIAQYPRTDAAQLAALELAHVAYDEGKLEEAAAGYERVLKALAGSNTLRPLVLYSLAQTQEVSGQLDQALASYSKLEEYPGFAVEALLGQGRLHERQGNAASARQAYEKVNGLEAVEPAVKELVSGRLAGLPAATPAP